MSNVFLIKMITCRLLLMGLALAMAFLTAPISAAKPQPNILFIAVDDWNDWVGCLGHAQAITPNLDRLAADGTLFTNAHCAAPVCNPSRTAVMLGRLPSSTGIYNNSHWERSTRVPLIIRAPGMTRPGSRCRRPVSLVDLYPTLIDLGGLPDKPGLDGRNIVPLLQDPATKWPYPAVCIQEPGNCAVRSEQWRYIRYSDGSEELYDHLSDPDEWTNLAARAEYRPVISDHARWVPRVFAPPAPSKDAYRFDPKAFTWIHKKTGQKTDGQEKQ